MKSVHYDRCVAPTVIFAFAIFRALVVMGQAAPYSVDGNTVAYWRFEETVGDTTADETGNNPGVASGTSIVDGLYGRARQYRSFGAGDFVTVPDSPTLTNLSLITVEAWVFPASCFWYREEIVQKGASIAPYNFYNLGAFGCPADDGTVTFEFDMINHADGHDSEADAESTIRHSINKWYYVVGTYDGVTARLYVNGILESEGVGPGVIVTNHDPLFIHNHTFQGGQSNGVMGGIIDEVRISNIARSADTIANTYKHAAPLKDLVVNGHILSEHQDEWVRFVAQQVVPQLLGDRAQRIQVAARASWWGLKEGTFSLSNPNGFSLCQQTGAKKPIHLKPLEACTTGDPWQVGLAAIQVPNFSDQEVEDAVQTLWTTKPQTEVLAEAATLAGFDSAHNIGAAIVSSTGTLRKSWLLRHPVVGITLVERNVTAECIDSAHSYCYGSGWKETADYAPTRDEAFRSIADLTTILNSLAP
jgi:Concanavalin A-like lectin/glucanases superfamily